MTDDIGEWGVFPPDDPNNPFYGLYDFDEAPPPSDPHEAIEREVLDALGIESFDSILFEPDERTIENARGNRFESIAEAITYLFDAGVLQFSGVVVGDEEIEIEIESDTGKARKGR